MEEVNNVRNRLSRIKTTHPNIYKLWNTYIEKKIDSLNLLIRECNNVIDVIDNDNTPDLTHDNLLTLFFMMYYLNNELDMT